MTILVGQHEVSSIGGTVRYPLPVIALSAVMLLPGWDALGWGGTQWTGVSGTPPQTGHCIDGHMSLSSLFVIAGRLWEEFSLHQPRQKAPH